jgi:hypothetical protein
MLINVAPSTTGCRCANRCGRHCEVKKRVAEYIKTPLGARSPHAGGWPLKTLLLRDVPLHVHSARTDDFVAGEGQMLIRFMDNATPPMPGVSRTLPLPFANLEARAAGATIRQNHGITGARAPR